ncbi:hypothetical protein LCGC14_2117100, partial [marine sediment metagenome]
WYCDGCDETYVAESEPDRCGACDGRLRQETDVLDTWFSSALWPFSTLGWPDQTPELDAWNPGSVLCTARDIITLWVSRMVMTNLYLLDRLPFEHVCIHTAVQDGQGREGRVTNLAGAIQPHPKHGKVLHGAEILLVDDVMTSGATLSESTRACIAAGARRVDVVTLARVAQET